MERSWLFVPGDSERKMVKAEASAADVLILDLEDSVASENTATARGLIRGYLTAHPDRKRQKLWVRINPLSTQAALSDLAGVMPGAPDGILLPKLETTAEIVALAHYLDALEAAFGLTAGGTKNHAGRDRDGAGHVPPRHLSRPDHASRRSDLGGPRISRRRWAPAPTAVPTAPTP